MGRGVRGQPTPLDGPAPSVQGSRLRRGGGLEVGGRRATLARAGNRVAAHRARRAPERVRRSRPLPRVLQAVLPVRSRAREGGRPARRRERHMEGAVVRSRPPPGRDAATEVTEASTRPGALLKARSRRGALLVPYRFPDSAPRTETKRPVAIDRRLRNR